MVAHPQLLSKSMRIDGIEIHILLCNHLLHTSRETILQLMQIGSLCVQDKCSILLHRVDNVVLLDAILMMASNKVSLFSEIVACDVLLSKVKIRDHHSSALVSIIVEVHLDLVIKNENENILKTKDIPISNQEK